MSQASPPTSPQPATPNPVPALDNPLKVVLFGMPAAGKSSLLGALVQAAQAQPGTLRAQLIDHSGGLADLRRRLYEDKVIRTNEEIVAYPVTLQSLPQADGSSGPPTQDVLLVDCDGQVVNTILLNQSLNGSGKGELQQAVLNADALILVVDISTPENLKKDFASFARFLRVLEHSRSIRNELNGLPVYLVLSKCDLLAKANDTTTTWMERIEETKRQVDRKFREFLAQQAARESQPFGKIDLRVWGTATGRPALGGAPARPQEPYQVAELFRLTLDAARQFRALRARASRKLGLAVGAIAAFLGLLLVLGLAFLIFRPGPQATALESEVRIVRSAWSESPRERYLEPVGEKIKQLRAFEKSSDFGNLPVELRDYVEKTRKELEAYQRYDREFKEAVVPEPRYIRNDAELEKVEAALKSLPLPPEYEPAWSQTAVGKRRERYQQELEVLRRTVEKTERQLRDLVKRGQDIKEKETLTTAPEKIRQLFIDAENVPILREDSRNTRVPGSTTLTWDNIQQFERVANAYRDWREMRDDLKKRT